MIINDEKKYIFIHVPRTSGTHMYHCLSGDKYDEREFGHIFSRKIKEQFPGQWKHYFKFSIVRNDFDRLHSWWFNRRYIRKSINQDFEEWLLRDPIPAIDIHANWDILNSWETGAQRTSQLDWTRDSDGNIIVDQIIHYENLKKDLQLLEKNIGVSFKDMPRRGPNNSVNRNYKNAYTAEMIEFVEEYHSASLKEFGYEF